MLRMASTISRFVSYPDIPDIVLAGRREELQRLLAMAESPLPSRCLVVGEAGMGKTRLMHELSQRFTGRWLGFSGLGSPYLHGNADIPGTISEDVDLVIIDDIEASLMSHPAGEHGVFGTHPRATVVMTSQQRDKFLVTRDWVGASRNRDLATIELKPLDPAGNAILFRGFAGSDAPLLDSLNGLTPRQVLEMAGMRRDGPSTIATLLGPDGQPLERGDEGFEAAHVTARGINDALIDALVKQPELMYKLSTRKFEELVAELYEREGFEVELTQASKDGGVDIYVVQRAPWGSSLTIVDCKRKRADRPVKVGLIRQLYGTVMEKNASVGVMATTSYFTKGAKALQEEHPHRLGLQDFISIQDMLKRAQGEASPPNSL
jgi:hypothetical protein